MKKLSEIKPNISEKIYDIFQLTSIWAEIVGEANSKISLPIKISKDRLTVVVFDNIYIQGFQFIKEEIIEKLKDYNFIVKDIKFFYKPKKNQEHLKKFKKITEEEKKLIKKYSAKIKNQKVRESYEKALTSYFKNYSLKDFLNLEKD